MSAKTISRLRSNPAYGVLVSDLREAIASGRLNAGDRISGEIALSDEYSISVTSVRRGIEVLVADGLLNRKQGSGTYVTVPQNQPPRLESLSVRRDTIAMVSSINLLTYHPYYSERLAGFRTGLTQQGWKLWEPELDHHQDDESRDFLGAPYNWNRGQLWHDIQAHQEFAGVLVSAALIPDGENWRPAVPTVSPDFGTRVPFVAYSWERETETCLRHLLEQGCRRLWIVGVFKEELLRLAAKRAAGALGVALPELILRRTSDNIRTLSASVQRAYQLARDDLVENVVRADGILVTSDFEAQGVLDALHESQISLRLPFVAMINKESRLHLPRQVTRLVLDGYRQGEALADMLHQLIVRPANAPRQVILNGKLEIYD